MSSCTLEDPEYTLLLLFQQCRCYYHLHTWAFDHHKSNWDLSYEVYTRETSRPRYEMPFKYIGDIITDQDVCIHCHHKWESHGVMGDRCVGALMEHLDKFSRTKFDHANDCKCEGFENSTGNLKREVVLI